jgi:cytochrome c biogenesis protein CcdA
MAGSTRSLKRSIGTLLIVAGLVSPFVLYQIGAWYARRTSDQTWDIIGIVAGIVSLFVLAFIGVEFRRWADG